jgi:hypothetical protein
MAITRTITSPIGTQIEVELKPHFRAKNEPTTNFYSFLIGGFSYRDRKTRKNIGIPPKWMLEHCLVEESYHFHTWHFYLCKYPDFPHRTFQANDNDDGYVETNIPEYEKELILLLTQDTYSSTQQLIETIKSFGYQILR